MEGEKDKRCKDKRCEDRVTHRQTNRGEFEFEFIGVKEESKIREKIKDNKKNGVRSGKQTKK